MPFRSRHATPPLPPLIILAAVAIPGAAFAQAANIQLYGMVDLFAGRSATSGMPGAMVVGSGGMTTSYWGVGGSESLGNGNSVNFAVEGFMRADTGETGRVNGEPMFARAANAGMAGNWGSAKLGRMPSPLFQASGALNPFGFSTRFAPLMTQLWIVPFGSAVMGDSGWSNAINYTTPTLNGYSLVTQMGLGEAAGGGKHNAAAVLRYNGPALSWALAAQRIQNGMGVSAATPSQRSAFAAGAYDFKAARLFASYHRGSTEVSGRENRMRHAGVAIPQGSGRWMLAWARSSERANARAPYRRDSASAGYDHNVSPRTDVYAIVMHDKLSTASAGNTAALGIRHRF